MKKHYTGQLADIREMVLRMGGLAEQMTPPGHPRARSARRGHPRRGSGRWMSPQVNCSTSRSTRRAWSLSPCASRRPPTCASSRGHENHRGHGADPGTRRSTSWSGRIAAGRSALKPLIDIPRMADIAQEMLKASLDAYVKRGRRTGVPDNPEGRRGRPAEGPGVPELLTFMMSDPTTIPRAMDLILVSRHIERIADHATNICEDVIFMVKGKDVRHQGPLA